MKNLFAGAYAPATLGSFLRAFTFGHVRQLDALAARWLVNVAAVAPIASGIDDYALVISTTPSRKSTATGNRVPASLHFAGPDAHDS